MAKKKFKISELSDEDRLELLSKRRVRVLSKYINKHYLENEKWLMMTGVSLKSIITYEILKGLNEEFEILRDDPEDPLIIELVKEKTELIITEIYKDNGVRRSKLN